MGSNLGDRRAHVAAAFDALAALPETRLRAASSVIQTDPVGPPGQGPYLNAAALIETRLPPRGLLDGLLRIELERGRDRADPAAHRWGPRTLDLDLLVYGDAEIDEPGLTVPHPRIAGRLFVLVPLAEIAPGLAIPGTGATASELLARLR